MPGKTKYPVFLISIIFFFLLQAHVAIAQSQPYLDKKVSFTFSDMSLANVLRAIGNKTGIKFSYNPDILQPGKRINMRFNNTPLRDVLKQLLNDPSISYREIGNQIVLYRGDPSQFPLEPNQQLIQGKPVIVIPAKKIPDTIYVYQLDTLIINRTDTIFRSISITRYDTIRIMDTVFIEKNKTPQNAGKNIKDNFNTNSITHRKFMEDNGFYTGLYFDFLPGDVRYKSSSTASDEYTSLMQNSVSGQSFNFSTGILAGYDYHFIGIRSGLGYTRLGEKFAYSFSVESGGFFKTDTVEQYYTLSGADTSWFYITDSTWIPKDSKNYSYSQVNSFNYIDVPVSVKLRFLRMKTYEIYALGGVNANFLISVDALHINPDNENEVISISENDLKKVLISWHTGIGASFKINPRAGLIAEACYRSQTGSQYKDDFPVDKRYGNFSIKVAGYIKF
jgi:hypothetical protein